MTACSKFTDLHFATELNSDPSLQSSRFLECCHKELVLVPASQDLLSIPRSTSADTLGLHLRKLEQLFLEQKTEGNM